MRVEVGYSGLADRQVKVAENEAKSLRVLFDNFDDPDWKHGDPIIGTMTFTDEPSVSIMPEPVRDAFAEIDELKAEIEKLKEATSGT